MTETRNVSRRLCMVLLVVGGLLVWGVPLGGVTAVGSGSMTDDTATQGEDVIVSSSAGERDKRRPRRFVDADFDNETPVTVYVGETLNVSNVTLTDRTDTVGTGDIVLSNLDDGSDAPIEGENADFSDVEPGTYSADANSSAEFRVQSPEIFEMGLYETKKEENELVSGRVDGRKTVYLDTRWNFDEADALELTVRDPEGLDVTDEVVDADESESASNVVNASVGEGYVAESGQDIALNFTGFDSGEYEVSVEGSELDTTQSVTVALVRDPISLSFESNTVIQGDSAVANLSGISDQTVYVRLDDAGLTDEVPAVTDSGGDVSVTNETAEQVFYGQDITYAVGGESLGLRSGTERADDLFIVVELGGDGEARFGVRTAYLDAPQNVTFTVAPASDSGSLADRLKSARSVDEATVTVTRREISVQQFQDAVATTDEFTVDGTAAGIDRVAVYARNDGDWEPLNETDGDNVAPVSNGTFSFETTATGRFALPDGYVLGIVSVEELETKLERDVETVTGLSASEWNELETATVVSVRTDEGALSARLQSDSLVVDSTARDEIELIGSASGQGDSLRLYIVGPRGDIYADDPVLGQEVDVSDGEFEHEFGESFTLSGTYHVLVVGRGRDGSFAANESVLRNELSIDRTPQQLLALLTDAYEQAGSDDQVVSLQFVGVNPSLTVGTVGQDDRVPPTTVPITGTTNRGDSQEIAVDVFDANGTLVAGATGEINASADRWTTSVNFSGFAPGTYRVVASGPDLTAERNITVVTPQMQAGGPAPRVGDAETPGETGDAETQTASPTGDSPPTPSLSFVDSLEFVVAVLGVAVLIALGLLARFRRER